MHCRHFDTICIINTKAMVSSIFYFLNFPRQYPDRIACLNDAVHIFVLAINYEGSIHDSIIHEIM